MSGQQANDVVMAATRRCLWWSACAISLCLLSQHAAAFSPGLPTTASPPSDPRTRTKCSSRGRRQVRIDLFRKLSNPDEVRGGGDRYGPSNNSTIPTPTDAAAAVGVRPAREASKKTWQRAWRFHRRMLPLLHLFDKCHPPDSSLSLAVLWWKALAGNDASSPAHDEGLSYDMLPRATRAVVGKRLRRLYPRLHHANVEIRTAYLDRAVARVISSLRQADEDGAHDGIAGREKIRLISLGAGYDVRSVKFKERGLIDEAVELDLPQVVMAKEKLLGPDRLLRRRPWLGEADLPDISPVDLNDVSDVKQILEGVVTRGRGGDEDTWRQWHNIFVFEGVMIYLDEGVPSTLLRICSDVLVDRGLSGSLCFADRLENVPEGDFDLGREELARNGWDLVEWLPKPGLARHMGQARLSSST